MSASDDNEAARAGRLAAALRENLRRRKAQAKGRLAPSAATAGAGAVAAETPAAPNEPGEAALRVVPPAHKR